MFFLLYFYSLDFFKYIAFKSFWFNKTVWNISIISAGRGNIKILVTNCHRCSEAEKLMTLIAEVWMAEHCYSYNYTVAYRSINYHGLGATSQDFPRLAINLEVFKSLCCSWEEVPVPGSKGTSQSLLKLFQFLVLAFGLLTALAR